jgi:hypothetical protein
MVKRFPPPPETSLKIGVEVRGPYSIAAEKASPPLLNNEVSSLPGGKTASANKHERRKLRSLTEGL